MSQENVEVVRAAFEAWNERRMDDLRELYDPGAMIVTAPEGWPEPPPTIGRDAVMRAWEYQREAFDTDTAEPIGDFIDLGDRVLVRFVWRGTGHGPESSMEFTGVYTVRKGKIFLVEHFRDHAETLEALDLSEQTTSNENVEIVRRVYEAAAHGDTAAIFELYDSDIEWDASRTERGAVTGKVARGKEALLKWLREWYEAWENIDDELEELIEVSDNKVISVMVQRGRGRASGIQVEDRLWTVWTIREGKVIRVVWFPTGNEAYEAAGLSEE